MNLPSKHHDHIVLVGLSDSPEAIPLTDLGRQLADYVRRNPNVIAPNPEVAVGLCVMSGSEWVPLTLDILNASHSQ